MIGGLFSRYQEKNTREGLPPSLMVHHSISSLPPLFFFLIWNRSMVSCLCGIEHTLHWFSQFPDKTGGRRYGYYCSAFCLILITEERIRIRLFFPIIAVFYLHFDYKFRLSCSLISCFSNYVICLCHLPYFFHSLGKKKGFQDLTKSALTMISIPYSVFHYSLFMTN